MSLGGSNYRYWESDPEDLGRGRGLYRMKLNRYFKKGEKE